MSQLQAILEYQEVDRELFKIEKELSGSEERKEYAKYKKFLEGAPERLDGLEAKAKGARAETEKLSAQYEQLEEALKDFENLDELVEEGADISFYQKKAQTIADKIKKVKADLKALVESIKTTDEEYQKLKKQVISIEKKFPALQQAYKALKAVKDEEKKPIEEKLAQLAKNVPAEMLEIYKTKRKEKIFPVVGELVGSRCPYCSMELPKAEMNKLSGGGWTVCETHNCSRILFK